MNAQIIAIISEGIALCTVVASVIVNIGKLFRAQRCQLRSEMLRTYYRHREEKTIRQYERENFDMLYEAYKQLHGNSFIDDVYKELREWKVIS